MELTLFGLALIVGSTLGYSGLDLARKLLVSRMGAVPLLFYLSALQLPFFAAWIVAAGRLGPIPAAYWPPTLASVALNIGANLAFMEAVRVSPLALTIPFLSMTPVFATLLAVPFLGEMPSPLQWLGIVVVVAGALRLNLAAGARGTVRALLLAFWSERGSVLMVLTALLWSLAVPLDKLAMGIAGVEIHGFMLNGGVAAGMLARLAAARRLPELAQVRRAPWLTLVATLFSVVALALFLLALQELWVGVVETLKRALGSMLALVLGRLFFTEAVGPNQIGAVLVMAAGVALVVW